MTKQDSETTSIESFDVPIWLTDVLESSSEYLAFSTLEEKSVDPDFRKRCREAAYLGLSLAKLRGERERIGFVPLSLDAYLLGLLKVTSISLRPILAWLRVEQLSQLGSASALSLARLAQGIGIELREALIHLRIGFAEQIDGAPVTLLVARQRSTGGKRSKLEECETVLGEIEAEYDLDSLRRLRRTEFEFRSAYKEKVS